MAFTIPVQTALLPVGFMVPPEIKYELTIMPIGVEEFSEREYSLYLRKTPCRSVNGGGIPWMLCKKTPNWSIVFSSDEKVYGTEYWVNYKPDGLLEYLRQCSSNYNLIYRRNGTEIFRLQVSQFSELGQWQVRITTIWHNSLALLAINLAISDFDVILHYMSAIFTNHSECAICLDDAYLEKWPSCTHSFCRACIDDWRRRQKNTCPLCRSLAL